MSNICLPPLHGKLKSVSDEGIEILVDKEPIFVGFKGTIPKEALGHNVDFYKSEPAVYDHDSDKWYRKEKD